jgi:hypothetical protein
MGLAGTSDYSETPKVSQLAIEKFRKSASSLPTLCGFWS